MQDVGLDNQGVNFDLADRFATLEPIRRMRSNCLVPTMRGIHTKDGLWPTNPKDLGEEVRLGKRKVDFARIMARLKDLDHRVKFTIER